MSPRRRLVLALLGGLLCAACAAPAPTAAPADRTAATRTSAPAPATPRSARTPLQLWLAHLPLYVAHRGGDGNWPEGTAYAYAQAARRNPRLALEVPVWRTSDGVWVVSEERTTGRVFGADYDIPSTPWSVLARLRTKQGQLPMARLRNDLLDVYGHSRILFIDNKQDTHVTGFLDLLDSYAGRSRYVIKCFSGSKNTAEEAHRRGYLTWGYYFSDSLGDFATTQQRFDLLGLNNSATADQFDMFLATGKPLIAHIIRTREEAQAALASGAAGLMVANVIPVVPAANDG